MASMNLNVNGSQLLMSHIAALQALSKHEVQAGWFDSDRYPAVTGTVGMPVAAVARLNEFGGSIQHPGGTKYVDILGMGTRFMSHSFIGTHQVTAAHTIDIPARPFMRFAYNQFVNNQQKLQDAMIQRVISGQLTPVQAMNQIGMELENQIVKSIKSGHWAPNAASTVSKKGFNKPLIETGHMWQTVNSKVI